MSMPANDELGSFYNYLSERIASGAADLSPEEAIDAWRAEHAPRDDYAETVVALRKAIAEMNAGDRGKSLTEFDGEFRQRHCCSNVDDSFYRT